MNKFFRALIAGWGAKKLGGGCLSTIIIFVIIYTLLGKCNEGHAASRQQNVPAASTVKADTAALKNPQRKAVD